MSFTTDLFEATDLQANQRGEISLQQRHNLQTYIDTQGAVFIGYLTAIGSYWLIFLGIVMGMFYQPIASAYNTPIMLMTCALVGVLTLPHATRQLMMTYQTLQNYRDNQVSYLYGICKIQQMRNHPQRYIVTFTGGQAVFVVDEPHIRKALKPGQMYHVYFIGGVLLSFRPAQPNNPTQ